MPLTNFRLAQRFWRRRSLKMVDGQWKDNGRWTTDGACLHYKLTNKPKGSGELKITNITYVYSQLHYLARQNIDTAVNQRPHLCLISVLILDLSQLMRLWYLSHRRPAKAQTSLHIRAVLPEPSLFAHMKDGSSQRVRPKIRHLAVLDGCACAFEE